MTYSDLARVQERSGKRLADMDINALIEMGQPVILRGAYSDKQLVQLGGQSDQAVMDFLHACHNDKPLTVFAAEPEAGGRFFYNADATALNFEATKLSLDQFFRAIAGTKNNPQAKSYYAGSTDIKTFFPQLADADALIPDNPVFDTYPPVLSIWMGNRTIAATHFDMSNNIAACMVGRRRFTLFPPDQIANLYPGPLFPTPAGQVVSMVNLNDPDHDKHPNFSKARRHAQVADLNPGDVLIYPAMWWHQVEALDDFNILINYWWNAAPAHLDVPMNTLLHGLLSLRNRPQYEKEAWRKLFDYYLFAETDTASEHLEVPARGMLGELDANMSRRLRMMILNKLNR